MEDKRILLFSTLNPYPFWAGSENLWFDFVKDERVSRELKFHVALADSPVTRTKAAELSAAGAVISFYKHFNVNFTVRNISRVIDKVTRKPHKTQPWYNAISKMNPRLVWFNVAALADLADLTYAVEICEQRKIPYWLLLQHGVEHFFLTTDKDIAAVRRVALGAKRFIFISKRNRWSLERAIGQQLPNAFHSVNAIPPGNIKKAAAIALANPVSTTGMAKFFNLGRFAPHDKAQHLLLEVLARPTWKERDWQLSFIGVNGFGKDYLEIMTRFFGIDPARIIIIPHTASVFEEIGRHDLLLMPSMAEGTPFAMIESMACGRPAVGTPVGGIPELIQENKTGWLCTGTDTEAVASAMENAWSQRNRWAETGEEARRFITDNYNEEDSFAGLLAILKQDMN